MTPKGSNVLDARRRHATPRAYGPTGRPVHSAFAPCLTGPRLKPRPPAREVGGDAVVTGCGGRGAAQHRTSCPHTTRAVQGKDRPGSCCFRSASPLRRGKGDSARAQFNAGQRRRTHPPFPKWLCSWKEHQPPVRRELVQLVDLLISCILSKMDAVSNLYLCENIEKRCFDYNGISRYSKLCWSSCTQR